MLDTYLHINRGDTMKYEEIDRDFQAVLSFIFDIEGRISMADQELSSYHFFSLAGLVFAQCLRETT